ncbi:MAG: hypothetical protein QOG20_2738 [Pseudonocardiales bacterium]|jgi:uncharacterized membrane protein|uniref:DUF2127 domain-containing protein n=1 Tax=Pseudonocardia sp. TaxID=60912 RepID=UPI00260E3A06|nr:DUF2127 domain-containing protein [Pseudonocardia sp.]MCW2722116.1 hypothetical protein [Pseudonocardia sp.]MDT7707131.1 hypothetical protein [Pseudonocardiales bacterium]
MTEGRGGELLFKIALAVKGLDGAIELIGAIVLLLIPTATVQALINDVISRDLLGPPDGSLATHFVSGTADFVSGNRTFAVLYLGLHGIVKLVLVAAMLRRIRPAYPVAVVVLGAFVVYEIYRATQTGSVLLPFLAALDVAIIVLIIREYRNLPATQAGPGR